MELEIAFTTRRDGVHIAYGTMGQGPPIVYPPGAFSRLELEMRRGADFFDALAKDHTLVSWDRHGVGHSDRNRTDFTFEDDVLDMEAVIDALKLDRFPVFGISDGGPIAIKYASRHLERVSCLVLYGTAASNESNAPARHALAELMRNDW
jgi:pimeloyl-ACP methyl ester carboxylesterase